MAGGSQARLEMTHSGHYEWLRQTAGNDPMHTFVIQGDILIRTHISEEVMGEPTSPINGGCLCGAVRYEALRMPFRAGYCHCRHCQRALGNIFGPSVMFGHEDFRFTKGALKWWKGPPKVHRRRIRSPAEVGRGRQAGPTKGTTACPKIGDAAVSHLEAIGPFNLG